MAKKDKAEKAAIQGFDLKILAECFRSISENSCKVADMLEEAIAIDEEGNKNGLRRKVLAERENSTSKSKHSKIREAHDVTLKNMRKFKIIDVSDQQKGFINPDSLTKSKGRGRNKKEKKEDDKPKKPMSKYMLHCADVHEMLKKEGKSLCARDMNVYAGELWREMSDAEKKKYDDLHEKLQNEYLERLAEYEKVKSTKNAENNEIIPSKNKEITNNNNNDESSLA